MKYSQKAFACILTIIMLIVSVGTVCSAEAQIQDEDGVLKIGILKNLTGGEATVGIPKALTYDYVVKEINANGGIGGMQIEAINVDCQTDNTISQEMVRYLVLEENCDVLIGGGNSAEREAIRPLIEELGALYFYDQQYEGGVASHNVFCTSVVPDHQIVTMVDFMVENFGTKFYIVAADYNFGQISTMWYKEQLAELGATVIGEEYVPMDSSQFSTTISNIQAAQPDVLIALVPGVSQIGFFEQLKNAGVSLPICSTTNIVDSYEHVLYEPPAVTDVYVTASFFEELQTDNAKAFIEKMRAEYPDAPYFGMECAAAYASFYFYKAAVEKCGTTDVETVIKTLESGITLENMPSGTITLDGATHHIITDMYLLRVDENHELQTIKQFSQVAPFWLSSVMGIDLREEAPNEQYSPMDVK